jgi:ABC-type amino acid transport system permease subunit
MKPVASLVSELGARVLAPGVDLLLFIQSATLQLELGDSWDLQQFFGRGWWNTLRISSLALLLSTLIGQIRALARRSGS